MAEKLTFETGIKEFDINGKATVSFNPTDAAFVERVYDALTGLEQKQDQFQAEVKEIDGDEDRLFAYSKERDEEMRGIIDGLLGEGVSAKLFGNMNCYALGEGIPIWMNLMFAITETIQKAFTSEQKKSDPRLKKLSGKYNKMAAKYKK